MDSEDFKEFAIEAKEMIASVEVALLKIELGESFSENYDVIFRAFHNLKGASGMMDALKLQAHMHELETILLPFKSATTLPKDYIGFFLRGNDCARALLDNEDVELNYQIPGVESMAVNLVPPVESPAESEPVPAPAMEMAPLDAASAEFFTECDEMIERISANLQKIESGAYNNEVVDALYREFHSMKGAAYLFSFQTLGDMAHIIETRLEGVRNQTELPTKSLVNGIFKCLKSIEAEIQNLKSGGKSSVPENSAPVLAVVPEIEVVSNEPSQKITATQTEDEKNFAALEMLTDAQLAPATPVVVEEVTQVVEKESEASTIRVSVALLDNLMTLMGEMVLVRNQVLQFSNRSEDLEFTNLSKRLNVVTNEIQDEMMKTRMQAIGNILNKFNRVVRDLSQSLQKNISLNLSGSETELDKSLLEAIKDPLTHIVRNSCDHGIETSDIRRKAGKSEGGTISIKSYHEGGQVVIEVSDDGKGLSKQVLLKKGIEKGLLTEAKAKVMTEKEIFGLIFAPGFSTAQKVTNVSGRGVGMDVVRTNIEKIGGTVELTSVEGKGTTIRLKIPLTLAIIPALLVRTGPGVFAIPQAKLIELVRVDQSSEDNRIDILHGVPVYRLRGNILPLVDLNKVLKFREDTGFAKNSVLNIAVLNADHCSFGLIVDEVQDTADIVVKPLNRLLKSLQIYSGATILGDGSVALILDVLGLSKIANVGQEEPTEKSAEAEARVVSNEQDYLVVRLNSPTKHAIVLGYVHRLEEFKRSDIEYSGNQKVIRYRQAILPIISANAQLAYGENTRNQSDFISVVVVERAGSTFGIEVDEIMDTLTTSADVNQGFVRQNGIFGNLNTHEELVVVVDPFELISHAFPDLKSNTSTVKTVSTHATSQLRILLAEDTPFFRKAITNVLQGAGHWVTVAGDGQEALDLFKREGNNFDLIVSDIEMPRLNGFNFARGVRASAVNGAIPMLAISSRADSAYVSEGKVAGFDLYLEKLKPEILLRAVNELTDMKKEAA